MTRDRIGLLMALLGIGLCGACGSSSSTKVALDADTTGLPDSGATIVGDAAAAGGTVALSGGTTATATGGTVAPSGGTTGTATGGTVARSGGTTGTATGGAIATGGSSTNRTTGSTAGKPIAAGTVVMGATGGSSTASCQQFIRLTNPTLPLTGYQTMEASAYLNDSRARGAGHLYLDGGKDAVILPGPAVNYSTASVILIGRLTTCTDYESICLAKQGYVVRVDERLTYWIVVDDWDEEIALGQVDLCFNNGTVTSQFVFAATVIMGGTTHVTITPILDGVSETPTADVGIESDPGW